MLSKKQVHKAGRKLVKENISEAKKVGALEVLNQWRLAHSPVLRFVQTRLGSIASNIDENAIIAQRLKRAPSIVAKLKKESQMSLARMQDIGGCRVVLRDREAVYRVFGTIKNDSSLTESFFRSEDYIKYPKDSGYRGIHLIHKVLHPDASDSQEYLVEIQLRTRAQHAWATTVEIVGTFKNENLKASKGNAEWLEFFSVLGSEIDRSERGKNTILPRIRKKDISRLRTLSNSLSAPETIKSFAISFKYIYEKKFRNYDYFILILDLVQAKVEVEPFKRGKLKEAGAKYLELEKRDDLEVVMVSAESLSEIKEAYPNYFGNTKKILDYIDRILST